MPTIELTKRQREIIYANVAMITKAFLELHSYASYEIKDVKNTKESAIMLCTQILGAVGHCLDLDIEDFKKIHKEIEISTKDDDNDLSNLSVDDFMN